MSDETTIVEGGSTAGLREAALAKKAAGPAPAKAAQQAPQFGKQPVRAATAVADGDARQAHRKLPSKAAEESEPDLSAIDFDAEPAANDNASASPVGETIRIGDHEIPISVLEQLPDEALRRIKRKLKAGGEELEVTLAEALDDVPKARGWQKRMWEASQREKRLEQIAQSMGTDPVGAYAALHGVTRNQAADALGQQLLTVFDREGMSAEERAAHDRQVELERKAAERDELMRREEERQRDAETQRLRAQYVASMKPALEAAGLRPTQHAIARVAMFVDAALRDGILTNIGPDELRWAASEVRKERDAETEAELPEDDGEALIARLGEKRARQIARAYAKRIQQQTAPVKREVSVPRAKPANDNKPTTWKEFFDAKNREAAARRR